MEARLIHARRFERVGVAILAGLGIAIVIGILDRAIEAPLAARPLQHEIVAPLRASPVPIGPRECTQCQ